MGMVLRNRLIALLIRLTILILYMVSYGPYLAQFNSLWAGLGHFCVEIGLVAMIVMMLEVIFNLIDLIRHGVFGVPAGPYMPIGLITNVFAFLAGTIYLTYLMPGGYAPAGTFAIMFNATLLVGPLIDWLFLEEKGTVRFGLLFNGMLFPILYHIFGYFRTVIWDDAPIYGTHMYAFPFLDYTNNPHIVAASFAYFGVILAALMLVVFLNDVLAGKYARVKAED